MSTELLVRPAAIADTWAIDDDEREPEAAEQLLERPDSPALGGSPIEPEFEQLADELVAAARGLSSTRRAMSLPAYQEIVALGDEAIPLVLRRVELGADRPIWLRVLSSLTSFEPGAGQETLDQAAEVWRRWGRHRLALRA